VLGEVNKLAADPEVKGVISDIGGAMRTCTRCAASRPEVEAKCKRRRGAPTVCKLLGTDHGRS